MYIYVNSLITPGYSELKWHGKTANHCDIYLDFPQEWRRIQDHNPHFLCDTSSRKLLTRKVPSATVKERTSSDHSWTSSTCTNKTPLDSPICFYLFISCPEVLWRTVDKLSEKYFSLYGQFSRDHTLKTVQSNDTFKSKFLKMQTPAELNLKMKAVGSSKTSVPIYRLTWHNVSEMQWEIHISHMLNSKDTTSQVLTVNIYKDIILKIVLLYCYIHTQHMYHYTWNPSPFPFFSH